MDIRERLNTLSKQQLVQLTADCNGGRVGFDHARVSKSDMIERLLLAHTETAISSVLETARYLDTPERPVLAAAPTGDAAAALAAAVQALAAQVAPQAASVDVETVERIVDARLAAVPARRIEVVMPGREPVEMPGRQHPAFEDVLRLVGAGVNVLLVGPAGCGKTHLAHQVATAMGKTFASISGSAGVSEAQLVGRLLPTGDGGRFQYTASDFIRQYTSDGAFLFDEMDAFDPNCLTVVNQATANGGFNVEARAASGLETYVKRSAGAVLMGSANTYGTGAGALYVGRNQLDAATLDRWMVVEMDYDREFERTQSSDQQLLEFVWSLRERVSEHKLRRVASTRMIQKGDAALRAGLEWRKVREMLLAGWTRDERSKCGVAA